MTPPGTQKPSTTKLLKDFYFADVEQQQEHSCFDGCLTCYELQLITRIIQFKPITRIAFAMTRRAHCYQDV